MKVFERVIKMHLLKHLQENDLIKQNQHGFVSGRSTQTQMLQHYSDVFEALLDDTRIDTIYLDFAKAFNKVNHHILIKKYIKTQNKREIDRMDKKTSHIIGNTVLWKMELCQTNTR